MVSTRHSLPNAAASPPKLSAKASKEMQKLAIQGNGALKGEAKKEKEKGEEKTYHWRGAVYVVGEDTPKEWVESQPERYLRREREKGMQRSSEEVGDGEGEEWGRRRKRVRDSEDAEEGAEDEYEEVEERVKPAKRQRRSMPATLSAPTPTTATKERKKPGPKPKRKSAAAKAPAEQKFNSSRVYDMCVVGGAETNSVPAKLPPWPPKKTSTTKPTKKRASHSTNDTGPATKKRRTTALDPIPARRESEADALARVSAAVRKEQAAFRAAEAEGREDAEVRRQLVRVAGLCRLLKMKTLELDRARELLERARKGEVGSGGGGDEVGGEEVEVVRTESWDGSTVAGSKGSGMGSAAARDMAGSKGSKSASYNAEDIDGQTMPDIQDDIDGRPMSDVPSKSATAGSAKTAIPPRTNGNSTTNITSSNTLDKATAEDDDSITVHSHPQAHPHTHPSDPSHPAPTEQDATAGASRDNASSTFGPELLALDDPSNPSLSAAALLLAKTHELERRAERESREWEAVRSNPKSSVSGSVSGTPLQADAEKGAEKGSVAATPVQPKEGTRNNPLHPQQNGTPAGPGTGTISTPGSGSTARTGDSNGTVGTFTSLRPTDPLPRVDKGGNELRWSIKIDGQSSGAEGTAGERYLVDKNRLLGENAAQKRRRVRRELEIVEGWAKLGGGSVVTMGGGEGK